MSCPCCASASPRAFPPPCPAPAPTPVRAGAGAERTPLQPGFPEAPVLAHTGAGWVFLLPRRRFAEVGGEAGFPSLPHGCSAPRAYAGPQPRMRLECTPPHDFRHAQVCEGMNYAELFVDRPSVGRYKQRQLARGAWFWGGPCCSRAHTRWVPGPDVTHALAVTPGYLWNLL